jgi:hypothetical protein
MKLYEIEDAILNCLDPETGEIIDEALFDELNLKREEKIENILLAVKNLTAEAKAIREEELNLAKRRKVAENKAESLKNFVAGILDGMNFKTPRVAATWRKSEGVVVSSVSDLMTDGFDSYLKYKEPEADKTKIKAALKSGVNIPGCYIEERNNLNIK